MRDVNHRAPVRLQLPDDLEQVLRLVFRQGRGGLIHDNYFGVIAGGLGDFDQLQVGGRKRARRHFRVDVEPDLLKQAPRLLNHRLLVDGDAALWKTAEPDVLHHRPEPYGVLFLMNHGDAEIQRLLGIRNLDPFAAQPDFARILDINPEQAFHQGGFSGAVFAHQRVDTARLYFQRNVLQSLDPRKRL